MTLGEKIRASICKNSPKLARRLGINCPKPPNNDEPDAKHIKGPPTTKHIPGPEHTKGR